MKALFIGLPVGWPGLVVIAAGGLLFFFAVMRIRFTSGGAGSPEAARSGISLLGIALQVLGFASTGFGSIRIALPAASVASLAEACAVAVLMTGAVWLFAAAAREMGRNWSLVARTRKDHELVTSGAFAHVRHPIYTAMGLFLLGLAVSFGHERNLIWGLPLFGVGTWLRVREEERLLRASFGSAYDDYAARVKRFLPGLV
ncbi:MAG TPA: isoprenylcysteine carboxylmethyltransferase family protein [Bradyrhizobium sp.]|uniref:methyltransferase family protein n=1 Tax=Bradyrhizobium sp. TaxID=376 RepID=UPI002B494582|nr:isoprenylcysteine carboxylmethyltransferase family protein [Bradyrhizobium sp.]HKO72935.1 isoprenylcysteine carboxylmethyltransferase family protein [Bradyrhizobium sp.]